MFRCLMLASDMVLLNLLCLMGFTAEEMKVTCLLPFYLSDAACLLMWKFDWFTWAGFCSQVNCSNCEVNWFTEVPRTLLLLYYCYDVIANAIILEIDGDHGHSLGLEYFLTKWKFTSYRYTDISHVTSSEW